MPASARRHILLISIGTGGDTLPFISWGEVLRGRGHDVTVLGNGAYRSAAEARGVPFVDLISPEEHQRRCSERDKSAGDWLSSGLENMLQDVQTVYAAIERLRQPETILGASTLCMGARFAQEKWGLSLATVAYPQLFVSTRDPMTWIGRRSWWVGHSIKFVVDTLANRAMRTRLNQLRQVYQLPPLRDGVLDWWHSPQQVIGFFPDWFAAPQLDWPPRVLTAGFAIPPVDSEFPLSPPVEAFLAEGPPPLVFSHSTALKSSLPFFREGIKLAKQLNCRAILLSPPPEVSADLPKTILAAPSTSHLRLFPRACMAIHHAGLGSTAAALHSGIPQFHVPVGVDQPQNAERCQFLGVSHFLKPPQFTAERALPLIDRLLHDPAVANRCRDLAGRAEAYHGLERASAALEAMM